MTIPPEEDTVLPGGVLEIPPGTEERQVARVKKMKANRDTKQLALSIKNLIAGVKKGEKENLLPYIVGAVESKATVEEIMGTIRTTMGMSWDPWGYRTSPFV